MRKIGNKFPPVLDGCKGFRFADINGNPVSVYAPGPNPSKDQVVIIVRIGDEDYHADNHSDPESYSHFAALLAYYLLVDPSKVETIPAETLNA